MTGSRPAEPVYRNSEQRWADPVVVSVQSRVAMGHVGNSAAVLPLQLAGFEVVDIPTALLSNHPFYPGHTGSTLPAATVAELVDGVLARGVGQAASAVLSGYLGTTGVAPVVADLVRRARAVSPGLPFVCDPVLGDDEPGRYVEPGLVAAYRDLLLPLADVATPNLFELDLLTGQRSTGRDRPSAGDVVGRAAALLGTRDAAVVVTGAVLGDTPSDCLDTVVVSGPPARRGAWRVRGDRVDRHFDGTGDLFSALLTIAWLASGGGSARVPGAAARAVAGTAEVVRATVAAGTKELRLVASVRAALSAEPAQPPSMIFDPPWARK